MANILTVVVTGLCALSKERDGMRVVLVDQEGDMHAPHHGFLLVDEAMVDMANTDRPVDFTLPKGTDKPPVDPTGSSLHAFRLGSEDLSFADLDKTTADPVKEPGDKTDCPEDDDFGWVLKTREIDPGLTASSAQFSYRDSEVLATALIEGGTFKTYAFAVQEPAPGSYEIVQWQFQTPKGEVSKYSRPRAIAEAVSVAMPMKDAYATILSTSGKKVRVKLPATAWLVNLPLNDVLFGRHEMKRSPEVHFVEIYRLLNNSRSYIPTPVDVCEAATGGMGNPKCPITFLG